MSGKKGMRKGLKGLASSKAPKIPSSVAGGLKSAGQHAVQSAAMMKSPVSIPNSFSKRKKKMGL